MNYKDGELQFFKIYDKKIYQLCFEKKKKSGWHLFNAQIVK